MLHLSTNIKKIRSLRRLTQDEFAKQMEVTINMQKSYEGGKAKPDLVYLERLANVAGVSIASILNGELSIGDIGQKVEKAENVPQSTVSSGNEKAPQSTDAWLERLDLLLANNTILAKHIEVMTEKLNLVENSGVSSSSHGTLHRKNAIQEYSSDKSETHSSGKGDRKKGKVIVKDR